MALGLKSGARVIGHAATWGGGGVPELTAFRQSHAGARPTCPHLFRDVLGCSGRQLVFPKSKHEPAARLEHARSLQVTNSITADLRTPVVEVGGGQGEVFGAAMPVAAINENGDPSA